MKKILLSLFFAVFTLPLIAMESDQKKLRSSEQDEMQAINPLEVQIQQYAEMANQGERGETALMLAAFNENLAACELLIEQGEDVNARNEDGTSVLLYAVSNQEIIKRLLELGADPNGYSTGGLHTVHDFYGQFGLSDDAFLHGLKILLLAGSNPNAQTHEGITLLMHASYRGNYELFELLLQHGADHTLKDNEQRTALDYALEAIEGGFDTEDHNPIAETLRNEDALHRVKIRRENNPAVTNGLEKITRKFGAINIHDAIFNREMGNK